MLVFHHQGGSVTEYTVRHVVDHITNSVTYQLHRPYSRRNDHSRSNGSFPSFALQSSCRGHQGH